MFVSALASQKSFFAIDDNAHGYRMWAACERDAG